MGIKKILLACSILSPTLVVFGQDANPYKSIGKKAVVVTAYGGRFDEAFDVSDIQRVGSVLLNIRTKKIVKMLNADSLKRQVSDNSTVSRWYSPDPLAFMYYSYSPYNFTLNNPIKNVDPDGRLVIGNTKDDAKKFETDLNKMLKDKAYDQFRGLIGLKGRTFKSIDKAAFEKASEGMSEDQKAFATTVFNSINSKDNHIVEYAKSGDNVSDDAASAFTKELAKVGIDVDKTKETLGGLPAKTLSFLGGAGLTTKTDKGSYSVIIEGLDAAKGGTDFFNSTTNSYGTNPTGMVSTAGHEVFGHGRSLAVGRGASDQHTDAIRMENLILRVMGSGNIQRDGTSHAEGTKVSEPSKLPGY